MFKASSKSILLVEDSEDDYESTLRAFKKAELHNPVHWCQSGSDAIDFLKRRGAYSESDNADPGLIMLDLNMPGLDGRRTLQIIKEDTAIRQIPVLIFTTSADQKDVDRCYQMGANTYVQKPTNFEDLVGVVQRLKAYWFEIALFARGASHD